MGQRTERDLRGHRQLRGLVTHQGREAVEGRLSPAARCGRRRAHPTRAPQEPPGARAVEAGRPVELHRAAPRVERARRRRDCPRRGGGRLAVPRGARPVTPPPPPPPPPSPPSPPPLPLRIGLTGPIGCGKSTVAGWLGELGARSSTPTRSRGTSRRRGARSLRRSSASSGRPCCTPTGASIARCWAGSSSRIRPPSRASRRSSTPPFGCESWRRLTLQSATAQRPSSSRRSSSSRVASPRSATRSGSSSATPTPNALASPPAAPTPPTRKRESPLNPTCQPASPPPRPASSTRPARSSRPPSGRGGLVSRSFVRAWVQRRWDQAPGPVRSGRTRLVGARRRPGRQEPSRS